MRVGSAGSVWETNSTYWTTRSCVGRTTRSGCCLPTSAPTRTGWPSWSPSRHDCCLPPTPASTPHLPQPPPPPQVTRGRARGRGRATRTSLPLPPPPPPSLHPSVETFTPYLPYPLSSLLLNEQPSLFSEEVFYNITNNDTCVEINIYWIWLILPRSLFK